MIRVGGARPTYTAGMSVNGRTTRRCIALALLPLLALTGCSGTTRTESSAPDTELIRDEERPIGVRRASIEGAREQFAAGVPDESLREALKSVAWSRSARQDLRIEALAALLADEANIDDTRNMLRLMLPTESAWGEWDVIAYLGDEARDRAWTDLAPSFVASLSRPQPRIDVRERPEYGALAGLIGEDAIVDLVFDVFAGTVDGAVVRERDRLDAWSLLNRLDEDGVRTAERLRALTQAQASSDPLLASLKRGADDLGVVAASGEELEWLRTLREPEHAEFWRAAAGVVQVLPSDARTGLALRHMAALVWASRHRPQWLAFQREDLLAHLEGRLDGRDVYLRDPGRTSGQSELFRRTREQLRWADALHLAITLEALDDGGLVSELFRQADIDHDDRSTEHGGIVTSESDSAVFFATHYPPRPAQRFGDNRFVASPEMIDDSADAIVHYHFHASDHKHRAYAGPSVGDLDYAALYARAALVFTFIDEDTLAVDYYQPDRTVVDVGAVTRP